MKLKPLVAAMAMIATGVSAEVRYSNEVVAPVQTVQVASVATNMAPVVNVVPVEHTQSFPQTSHVCRQEAIPIYRNVPVVSVSESTNSREEVIGTIVGAVAGAALTGGTSATRIGGALIGGSVGYAIGKAPSRTTTVHGYTTEFAGYQDVQRCEVVHGSYDRKVVIGYQVTYDDNGVLKTVTMTRHPGAYVRVQ